MNRLRCQLMALWCRMVMVKEQLRSSQPVFQAVRPEDGQQVKKGHVGLVCECRDLPLRRWSLRRFRQELLRVWKADDRQGNAVFARQGDDFAEILQRDSPRPPDFRRIRLLGEPPHGICLPTPRFVDVCRSAHTG